MEELEIPLESLIICSRYTITAKKSGELRFRSSVGSGGTATKIASQISSFETRSVLGGGSMKAAKNEVSDSNHQLILDMSCASSKI